MIREKTQAGEDPGGKDPGGGRPNQNFAKTKGEWKLFQGENFYWDYGTYVCRNYFFKGVIEIEVVHILGTTSCQLTQTQILFSVKSISFWSYLKVYRGFTEKKPKEKFFLALPKKISDLQNFSHKSKTFTKLVIAQILLILHAFRKILHRLLCSAVI